MPYVRVLPRDLFNEAKLLKCLGQLCLHIHDQLTPVPMSFEHDGEAFEVCLDEDQHLYVYNLEFKINDKVFCFGTPYNSKDSYPLHICFDDYTYIRVFNESGEWTSEFIDHFKSNPT